LFFCLGGQPPEIGKTQAKECFIPFVDDDDVRVAFFLEHDVAIFVDFGSVTFSGKVVDI